MNEGKDPSAIHHAYIDLIPECKNPKSPKDFRPIILCNMVMKLVTKTVANHLKKILPDIIDPEKSASIRGRLIIDNAFLEMECFRLMKKKKVGKKEPVANIRYL